MKEFLGIGGYVRQPEGFFSWQHLAFVTGLMIVMTVLAIIFGRSHRKMSIEGKNKPLLWAAILIDSFEIFKIVVCCIRSDDWSGITQNLPLFLCSIQLITIVVEKSDMVFIPDLDTAMIDPYCEIKTLSIESTG